MPSEAAALARQPNCAPNLELAETSDEQTYNKIVKEDIKAVDVKEQTQSKPRESPCTFFDLPFEIWTKIYTLAFIRCRRNPNYIIRADQFLPLALLLTSRAVGAEVYQCYVKTLVFRVVADQVQDYGTNWLDRVRAKLSYSGRFAVGFPFSEPFNRHLVACVSMKNARHLCPHMSGAWYSELKWSLAKRILC